MPQLLLFGQAFPVLFDVLGLGPPLLADDLGDLRVGKPWVLGDDLPLVVLSVKYEGYQRRRRTVSVPASLYRIHLGQDNTTKSLAA